MRPTRTAICLWVGLLFWCGAADAAETRRTLPGRAAYPLIRPDGTLVVVFQNPGTGLGMAISEPEKSSSQSLDILPGVSASAPVIKMDRSGRMALVWAQRDPGGIFFCRIPNDIQQAPQRISRGRGHAFSPDLDFDGGLNPWIAWIEDTGQAAFVCVADPIRRQTWIVNRPYSLSALNPKILAGGPAGIWVLWTGRDRGRDEIFASRFWGGSWSAPCRLNRDDRIPHFGQAAALGADGFPRAVWASYDGAHYQIFTSSWDGEAWSVEEKVTENAGSNTSPCISFVSTTIPLIVWSRTVGRTGAIFARFKHGYAWSPEIEIAGGQTGPARSPRVSIAEDRIGLTWDAGDNARSLQISFQELAGKQASARGPLDPPPVYNPARDENQYTGFGDSITDAEGHGYLPRLEPLLIQKYGSAKVWNEGYGGETTVEGLARFDQAIELHPSRYLMLMEGTNDVIFDNISMDTTAFDLKEMVRRSFQSGVLPLIATIIPRKDWRWTIPFYQNRIFDLNARIRTLATAQKVPLVDQFNVFYYYAPSDGGWQSLILDDGVHPNPKGFQVMADAWFEGIKILPFPPVRVRLTRTLDKTVFLSRSGNVLRWQNSLKFVPGQITAFKIYRKERPESPQAFKLLAVFPYWMKALDYRYFDVAIVAGRAYAYVITALRKDGIEGSCSETVSDLF